MQRSRKIITHQNIKSPISEAYRTLRTNLQFSLPEGELKTILVTSSGPGEGKSTVSSNLAITMAQSDLKVLLIDADLRKSVVHNTFNLPNLKGLTNILVENMDYKQVVAETQIENLDVITGGPKPPNPSELLGSHRMSIFLKKMKEIYDVIILDTPPLLPVTDGAVLSALVDGVVLVAAYGYATIEGVNHAKSLLEKVNARILGVVLNQVPSSVSGEYYYYYYYEDEDSHTPVRKSRNTGSSEKTGAIN